jgi:hypothetical protein
MKIADYLTRCAVLPACFVGVALNPALAQPPAQAPENGAGISLDVVGIKPGMTIKDAMIALKADNPRLTLVPSLHQFEGFAEPIMPSVTGSEQQTPDPKSGLPRATENVMILFTVLPKQEAVWGVQRNYVFAASERPLLQKTLDALHKKYGPESIPADPDPRSITKSISWIYDDKGMPLGPRGASLRPSCAGFSNYFGSGDLALVNDIQAPGQPLTAECKAFTMVNVTVLAGLDPASSQYIVNTLIVTLADPGRYRTAIEATRAVIQSAAKSREQKQTQDVNKRPDPKL